MNIWSYHDKQIKRLKQVYNKANKQTQNRIQELIDTFNFNFDTLYNIVDSKTKKRINTYIEQWKEQGLLTGYFGLLAKSIYVKTKVKNNEILELLIYSAYQEEQNKVQETELNIFKDVANHYYQEGQKEVYRVKKENKKPSVIPMAIFLALLNTPNCTGLTWEQYKEATKRYDAQQLYKQVVLNLQQKKEVEIENSEFQRIIQRQNNQRLCINQNKISGVVDLQTIGLNNMAKIEGMKSTTEDDSQVEFWAVTDENSTDMCQSMNGMKFYINKENRFDRYWGETKKELKLMPVRVKGLVLGINLPPIMHFTHWCRSTIRYIDSNSDDNIPEMKPLIKQGLKKYNEKELKQLAKITNDIANKYTNNKSKWSGEIVVDNKNPPGKLWNCDIRVGNETAPHILLHEQLHAHSISYFDKEIYDRYSEIEEATVQLYTQEISKKEGIHIISSEYDENINILKEINNKIHIGKDDFEFAKILFAKPVNKRIDFIEDKIYDIMREGSVQEYMELNNLLDTFRR